MMHLHSKYNENVPSLEPGGKERDKSYAYCNARFQEIHVVNTFYGQNMMSLSNLNIDCSEKLEPERMQNMKSPGLLLVC